MKRLSLQWVLILCGVIISVATKGAEFPSAESLLKDSDRSRGALLETGGMTWQAKVLTVENDDKNEMTYSVKVKQDDALAEVSAPARQKGERILFNDRILWFYKPGLRKPVSISPRQRLSGQASNGDIASTRYARDYDGVVKSEENVEGQVTYLIELKAKAKNVTYDQIRYWVSKKDHLGVKAEFLTLSGQVFKRSWFKYGNEMKLSGRSYPFVSEMKIQDALNEKNTTTISYFSPKVENHPAGIFNVNQLVK
jgi:hypothetical protein